MYNSMIPWTAAARLLYPWNSPGKNTGVGCHFLLHILREPKSYMKGKVQRGVILQRRAKEKK